MILNGKNRSGSVAHSLHRPVIQVQLRHFHIPQNDAFCLHRITMILRSDIASACLPVINPVIGTTVTVFQEFASENNIGGVIGTELVMPMILWFYMANECLSITENVANAGVPVPKRLKSTLRQVKEGKVRR